MIWRNEYFQKVDNNITSILIDDLKKYMTSNNYIKINKKPVLSINNPKKILNIGNIILNIRKEAQKKIGEIFIVYPFKGNYKKKTLLRNLMQYMIFQKKIY